MLLKSKHTTLIILLCISIQSHAQILQKPNKNQNAVTTNKLTNDTILQKAKQNRPSDSLKIYNPTIGDYNFWTQKQPKQTLDTLLTIESFYKQNVYGKDLFAYQQLSNLGQTLNPLQPYEIYDNLQLLPTGKSVMYIPEDEVKYYDVKTPTTEFVLENGYKEGQFLSTTFAHNIHSRFNYAINYRYLKSQGRYLNTLANNSNIVLSTNYQTKNNRYQLNANFVTHDFNNQENAGITQESITAFIENDENFSNRDRMTPNLSNAQSLFDERRVHVDHQFGIISFSKKTDSLATAEFPLYIKHDFTHKHQAFTYEENTAESYYTSDIISARRFNKKRLNKTENRISLGFKTPQNLQIEGGILHQNLKIYYDSAYVLQNLTIPEETQENRFGLHGNATFTWKEKIRINADGFFTRGNTFGNQYQLNATATMQAFQNYQLHSGIRINSAFPSLNHYTNQSFYNDFNYHNPDFKNQNTQEIFTELTSQKLGFTLYGAWHNRNNLVYVDTDYQPKQITGATNYLKIGVKEKYTFGQFGIDLRAQYQKMLQNADNYPIPSIIARATAYYDRWAFKNNAHIQTGLTAHYYSQFPSREFFPVTNEFMLQDNSRSIGNYPQVDAFFNIKVDRMRIYFRGQNLNSFFMRGDYFSTPTQPARDFKIQFGIHWFLFT